MAKRNKKPEKTESHLRPGKCVRCERQSVHLVRCPRCGEDLCTEECIPFGAGTLCRDCEEAEYESE